MLLWFGFGVGVTPDRIHRVAVPKKDCGHHRHGHASSVRADTDKFHERLPVPCPSQGDAPYQPSHLRVTPLIVTEPALLRPVVCTRCTELMDFLPWSTFTRVVSVAHIWNSTNARSDTGALLLSEAEYEYATP
jgi:hypothetical protein